MNGVFISLIHSTQKVPKSAISNLIQIQNDSFQQLDIEFKDKSKEKDTNNIKVSQINFLLIFR